MARRSEPQDRFEISFSGRFSADDVCTFLDTLKLDTNTNPITFEFWKIRNIAPFFLVSIPRSRVGNFKYILENTIPNATLRRQRIEREKPDFAYELKMTKSTTALFSGKIEAVSSSILVNLLSSVGEYESVCLQFIIYGRYPPKKLDSEVYTSEKQGWLDRVFSLDPYQPKYAAESYKARYARGGFVLGVRLGIAADADRARVIKSDIERGFQMAEILGSKNIVFTSRSGRKQVSPNKLIHTHIPQANNYLTLSTRELAGYLAFPCGGIKLGKAEVSSCPVVLKPPLRYQCTRRIFAEAQLHGQSAPIGLPMEEAVKHTLFFGSTGVGKSNSLGRLCVDDIHNGISTLFVDPKSDTINAVISRVPEGLWKYLAVIRLDGENVVGINPFDPIKQGADEIVVADSILKVFRDISGSFWGPQIEHYLKNALRTMEYMPTPNLLLLNKLLTSARFREDVVGQVSNLDPLGLGTFWDEFERKSDALRARELAPVLRRVIDLIGSTRLQAILGQTNSKFDLGRLFNERLHVLVALNGTLEGNDAKMLGQLISSMAWNFTLSRTKVPDEKRIPVSIYIDELQDFMSSPDDISSAFSQARALKVGFTVACQYLNQLNRKLRDSIIANAQNVVAFRIQDEHDARLIENLSGKTIDKQSLLRVPRFGAYFKTEWAGQIVWMLVSTLEMQKACTNRTRAIAFSEESFGRPQAEVMDEVKKLIGLDKKEAKLAKMLEGRLEIRHD